MISFHRGAIALAALAALSACTDAEPAAGADEPALGPVTAVHDYADIAFPLDAFEAKPDQRRAIALANSTVISDCARRFGFTVPVSDPAPEIADRAIGLVSARDAAATGYNTPEAEAHARAVDAAKQQEKPTSQAMTEVLTGTGPAQVDGVPVPRGGCMGEARRALGTGLPGEPGSGDYLVAMAAESSDRAESDSRLRAAFGEWSECMGRSGHAYPDPWAANDDPAFAGDTATPTELATARADVVCRDETGLNGTWVAIRSAYQRGLVERNADGLRLHGTRIAEQSRTASDILAAAGRK